MFVSVQSAYAVFVAEHLPKSTMDSSNLLYYSSLIFVYQFFCQRCVALSLYWGYLHLSLQVCFGVSCLVFLWSLLHYSSVHFCPLLVLCLCCSVLRRCLLMFLLLKAWKMENSSLAAFQTNCTYLPIIQNITTDISLSVAMRWFIPSSNSWVASCGLNFLHVHSP